MGGESRDNRGQERSGSHLNLNPHPLTLNLNLGQYYASYLLDLGGALGSVVQGDLAETVKFTVRTFGALVLWIEPKSSLPVLQTPMV